MLKITLREIRYSFGRFMAILLIVALGVGFFAGLKVTDQSMIRTANAYLKKYHMYDYQLISSLGYAEGSAAKLASLEGVEGVAAQKSLDLFMDMEGEENQNQVVKLYTIPKDEQAQQINALRLVAGRLPEKVDELVLDRKHFKEDILGQTITVSEENEEDTLEHVKQKTYTITGLVASPLYIHYDRGNTTIGDGNVDLFAYVPEEALDMDYETGIYVSFADSEKMDIYSEEYASFMDAREEEWKAINEELATSRYEQVKKDAEAELADGQETFDKEIADVEKELSDARKELKDAEKKLTDAKKELEDGRQEIADGEKELQEGKDKLKDSEKTIKKSEEEWKKGQKDYDKGLAEYKEGKKAYDQGKEAYDAGKAQFEKESAPYYQGLAQYESGRKSYDQKLQEYQAARKQFDQGKDWMDEETRRQTEAGLNQWKKELEQADQTLKASKAALDQSRPAIEAGEMELSVQHEKLLAAQKTMKSSKTQLDSAKKKLDQGKKAIEKGKKQIQDGKKKIEENEKKLVDARQKLDDGEKDYQQGLKDYEEGQKDYQEGYEEYLEKKADGEEELEEARQKLADLKEAETWLLGRDANEGYASFENDSTIVGGIAKVFPIFFFLVAALVCMTTMTRMLEEERTQIGIYKALGYSDGAILGNYLLYSGLAAMTGGIVGFFLGTWLFPVTIWAAYGMMYDMGSLLYTFDPVGMGISILVAALCSMGATLAVCYRELQEMAASLMRPKAPKTGQRVFLEGIPWIWNRLAFLDKVSVRNLFRYKKRFFMMIIGISGCTALLVTGFGIRDSITGIADKQFKEIFAYQSILGLKEEIKTEEAAAEQYHMLDDLDGVDSGLFVQGENVDAIFDKQTKSVNLVVAQDMDRMMEYIHFYSVDSRKREEIARPETGTALISAKLAEHYHLQVGDSITLRDSDFRQGSVTVAGIFQHHFNHYIYLSGESYQQIFGRAPAYNQMYLKLQEGGDPYLIAEKLLQEDSVQGISINEDTRDMIDNMMSSMNYVVLLVIVCAGLLAFVVIYNLNNINITERIREIATIKVLGFYMNETKSYIFRENVVLTLLGGLLGLGLGYYLHSFVMHQIDLDAVAFDMKIHVLSYVLGLILTFLFNSIVNLFMTGKIDAIDMAESLKSVE